MHFTRLLCLLAATAVHGLVIAPNAAEPVRNTLAGDSANLAQPLDEMDLVPRAGGGSIAGYGACLFNFPIFRINQSGRQSFQRVIDRRITRTYTLPGNTRVELIGQYVTNDRHLGVIIHSDDFISGSIVLSNYESTRTTAVRETIEVDFHMGTTRTCVRLPRLDGTWYVQKS